MPRPKPGSYDVSYPEFLAYFRNVDSIDRHHLIIGANFSYGWMPTILDFRDQGFESAVDYLRRSRLGADLDVDELHTLSKVINNSMVGASKLLHFVAPTRYAIWDSRVAAYLKARLQTGRRAAEQYAEYNDCCRAIADTPDANEVVAHVSSVVGYAVCPTRALELVMYHGGLVGRSYKA